MKKSALALISLATVFFAYAQNCGCNHNLTTGGVKNAANFNYKPGDVFCIQAGTYGFFRFVGFEGTKEKPLIFKNCGGRVTIDENTYPGLQFLQSKHIIINGSGSNNHEYGIRIAKAQSSGISISGKSTDVEIHHVEVTNTGFACIVAKTDPTCEDSTAWRGNFVMENLKFHHNYLHDNREGEGYYIGYTGNYEVGKTVRCVDNSEKVLHGHLLRNIEVYNNIIENISWDGLQVALGIENVKIYNNRIVNYGVHNEPAQNQGIAIGSGTSARVYNNFIMTGPGHGIANYGLGPVYIYNNIIVGVKEHGIFNSRQNAVAPAKGYYIANNTIINPTLRGIMYYNGNNQLVGGHEFYNNVIINPGSYSQIQALTSSWQTPNPDAFIGFLNQELKQSTVSVKNYYARNIANAKFANTAADNYTPAAGSPLINGGSNVVKTKYGFDTDFSGYVRTDNFDMGALEFRNELIGIDDGFSEDKSKFASPNPILQGEDFKLVLGNMNSGLYSIELIGLNGAIIPLYNSVSITQGDNELLISGTKNKIDPGFYLVKISGEGNFHLLRLQIN